MQIVEQIREIHRRCHRGFRYREDQNQYNIYEDWRSHADEVRAGRRWYDDCDGFACTAAVLALEDYPDIRPEWITLNYCEVPPDGGHLVCCIRDGDKTWCVDNRYQRLNQVQHLNYKWQSHMRASKPGKWYKTRVKRWSS